MSTEQQTTGEIPVLRRFDVAAVDNEFILFTIGVGDLLVQYYVHSSVEGQLVEAIKKSCAQSRELHLQSQLEQAAGLDSESK